MQAEVAKLVNQINGLLPGATSAGLASAFELRKINYKDQLKFWTIVRFASIAAFIIYGITVFWDFHSVKSEFSKASLPDMVKIWGIYLFNKSPIIVALILLEEFSRRTFNKLFKLEEDYTHKQVLSQSFEGYKKQFQEIGEQPSSNELLNSLCSKTISAISENPIRLLETEKERGSRGLFGSLFTSKKISAS
jgi:hypothetical protein